MVTRARRCAADVRTLFDAGSEFRRWALVQTNHDHWLVDPVPFNDGSGPWDRAGSAMKRLGLARPGLAVGGSDDARAMTVQKMWEVLGRVPNMRPYGNTMVSAVMVPAKGAHDVRWVRGLGTSDEYFWAAGGAGDAGRKKER